MGLISRVWCTEAIYKCDSCGEEFRSNDRLAYNDDGMLRWICEGCLMGGMRDNWAELEEAFQEEIPSPLIGGMMLQLFSEKN